MGDDQPQPNALLLVPTFRVDNTDAPNGGKPSHQGGHAETGFNLSVRPSNCTSPTYRPAHQVPDMLSNETIGSSSRTSPPLPICMSSSAGFALAQVAEPLVLITAGRVDRRTIPRDEEGSAAGSIGHDPEPVNKSASARSRRASRSTASMPEKILSHERLERVAPEGLGPGREPSPRPLKSTRFRRVSVAARSAEQRTPRRKNMYGRSDTARRDSCCP